jgi:hypothetical protein
MSKATLCLFAALLVTAVAVPRLHATVQGEKVTVNGTLTAGQILCGDIIGLDNSTYINYNTYATSTASVKFSVWFGTDPSSNADYTRLFFDQAFAIGATVNQTNYPTELTSFPLYFQTCINNNSGGSVTYSICENNEGSCP